MENASHTENNRNHIHHHSGFSNLPISTMRDISESFMKNTAITKNEEHHNTPYITATRR